MQKIKINIFNSDGQEIIWNKSNTELQKNNLNTTVKSFKQFFFKRY